jgi:hypothetical protein
MVSIRCVQDHSAVREAAMDACYAEAGSFSGLDGMLEAIDKCWTAVANGPVPGRLDAGISRR